MEYTFVKQADQSLLDQQIKKSIVADAYTSASVVGSVIIVNVSRSLSRPEFGALRQVVLDHVPPSAAEAAVQAKIVGAMQFGQQLLIQVAADNVMLGFTTAQVMAMLQKYSGIQAMLMSGSLYTALQTMESIQPDALVSAARRDKYCNMIKGYLGI